MEETPLRADWVAALLSTPDAVPGTKLLELTAQMQEQMTLLDRLNLVRSLFQEVLNRTRESLVGNPLLPVIATAAAKESNFRGEPEVAITDKGDIVLRLVSTRPTTRTGRKHTELFKLRQKATALGVDISSFGRSKPLILSAIARAEDAKFDVKVVERQLATASSKNTDSKVMAKAREERQPSAEVVPSSTNNVQTPKPEPVTTPPKKKKSKVAPEGPGAEELLAGLFDATPAAPKPEAKPESKPEPKTELKSKDPPLPKMAMLDAEPDSAPRGKVNLKALVTESEGFDLDRFLDAAPPAPVPPEL
jgi:hypothetical protein